MKKIIAIILTLVIIASLAACSTGTGENNNAMSKIEDVTMENIISASTPKNILETNKIFRVSSSFENTGDDLLEGSTNTTTYALNNDICEINITTAYSDGYKTNSYFSTDKNDAKYYTVYDDGKSADPLDDGYAEDFYTKSLLGYSSEDTTLGEVKEENNLFVATIKNNNGCEDTIYIDPSTGKITKAITKYESVKSSEETTCTMDFDYSNDLTIDYTAKIENGGTVSTSNNASVDSNAKAMSFDTTDINNNPVNTDEISKAKLVLVNYWEPWCGPCVSEMPDLQKLYDNYKDKGLMVLGVYSTFDQDTDAKEIVEENKITYPILRCNDSLKEYQQSYVPATYFTDGNGVLLNDKPEGGAHSYEEWEKIVLEYLNK